jgi:hypothetical protein
LAKINRAVEEPRYHYAVLAINRNACGLVSNFAAKAMGPKMATTGIELCDKCVAIANALEGSAAKVDCVIELTCNNHVTLAISRYNVTRNLTRED